MSLALNITRNSAIPLRLRKKIGKLSAIPDNRDFTVDVFGRNYAGRTDTHLDRKVYQYGLHEPATIRLIRGLLQDCRKRGQKAVYVDIGTNTGLHMLAVADCADAAFGFEPWEKVRAQAERNLAANHIAHCRVFPFGLSDRDAVLSYQLPPEENRGAGFFAEGGEGLKLEVKAGDAFFSAQGIEPAVIKIDVEGHEKKVLSGLAKTLKKSRPAVIFEYGSVSRRDFSSMETMNAIFGEDYRYYGIKRSREMPSLKPFSPSGKWENVLAAPASIQVLPGN